MVNQSSGPQDSVVELIPSTGNIPAGWPTGSASSPCTGREPHAKLASPGKLATPPAVRVRVGDREMLEVKG